MFRIWPDAGADGSEFPSGGGEGDDDPGAQRLRENHPLPPADQGAFSGEGNVYIRNRNIYGLERKDFARGVAIVQQHNTAAEDITVEELVSFGRTPHQKFYGA